jgi:hypothetical protein
MNESYFKKFRKYFWIWTIIMHALIVNYCRDESVFDSSIVHSVQCRSWWGSENWEKDSPVQFNYLRHLDVTCWIRTTAKLADRPRVASKASIPIQGQFSKSSAVTAKESFWWRRHHYYGINYWGIDQKSFSSLSARINQTGLCSASRWYWTARTYVRNKREA